MDFMLNVPIPANVMFAGNDRFSMKSKLYARENLGSTKKTKKQIKTNILFYSNCMSQKAPLPSLTGHRLKTRKRGKFSRIFD